MSKDNGISTLQEVQTTRNLAKLSAFLQSRIGQAQRGEFAEKTFDEIRKTAHKKAGL